MQGESLILDVKKLSYDKPLLLIDVDGVLNAINTNQGSRVYNIFKAGPFTIRFRHELGDWLKRLSEHFHLIWATMWDAEANTELAPRLGLPHLPYIPCWDAQDVYVEWNGHRLHTKVPCIEKLVEDWPFAWIDDTLTRGDLLWAEWRERNLAPTHLLKIDPRMGLLEHHVNKLIGWAKEVG